MREERQAGKKLLKGLTVLEDAVRSIHAPLKRPKNSALTLKTKE